MNEEQLIAALRPFAFERITLTGVSIREQAALFHDAEWILALTGSGPTNIMFGRQGGTLTELFPSGWVNFFQWILCDHIGYRYSGLRAVGRKVSRGEEMRYLLDDFEIAPQRVVQFLHKIGLS
jgi:capsular polysaccharide biosynthesis protein